MEKKLSRKERRAEKFGHSSPSRADYALKFEERTDYSYMRDVLDAKREMHEDVRCQKAEHYFNDRLKFLKDTSDSKDTDSDAGPQYRDELFFLTH